jgi:phosphopantetheine adenylyltransferase
MTEYNLPEKDDAPWLDTTYDGFMTHEEMIEIAAQREAANEVIVAKVSEEDYQKVMNVAERQELINEALEELNAIVLGGQDTREFYLSVSHIRNVLERLK